MASFIAAGTAYATHGTPTVPFYTFYSMFGFQRVGDLIWQAADARTRGFLLGATAGRTTLLGEGLQHQDGHSLVLASHRAAVPGLRPGVRLRGGRPSCSRACSACTAPRSSTAASTPTSSTTSRSTTRTTRCRRCPTHVEPARHHARPVPLVASAPEGKAPRTSRCCSAARRRPGRARGRRRTSREQLRRRRRAVVGHVVQGAARRGARGRAVEPPAPRARSRGSRSSPSCSATTPAPIVAVTDFMKIVPEQVARFVPESHVRAARHRRHGPQRHPRGAAPALRDRRRPRRGRRAQRPRREGAIDARRRSRRRSPTTASIPTCPTRPSCTQADSPAPQRWRHPLIAGRSLPATRRTRDGTLFITGDPDGRRAAQPRRHRAADRHAARPAGADGGGVPRSGHAAAAPRAPRRRPRSRRWSRGRLRRRVLRAAGDPPLPGGRWAGASTRCAPCSPTTTTGAARHVWAGVEVGRRAVPTAARAARVTATRRRASSSPCSASAWACGRDGWREAAGKFGEATPRSVADSTSPAHARQGARVEAGPAGRPARQAGPPAPGHAASAVTHRLTEHPLLRSTE